MEKNQIANWNRQLKIQTVYDAYTGATLPPLVLRVFGQHTALLQMVTTLMGGPEGRSEGATLKKSAEEKRAIAAVLPVANALYLLHLEDETDDQASEKAHALRRNKTDYTALPAAVALAETRRVAQQALALKTKLASDAGIAKPELDELGAANVAFGQLLAAPKLAIEAGKTNRTALDTALKAADLFVEAKLRPATKTLGTAFTGLREALLQAMRIDDAPGARHGGAPGDAPAPGSTPA